MATKLEQLAEDCRRFAVKYNYTRDNLRAGFEALLAHLFVREEAFRHIAGDDDPDEIDLGDYLPRRDELGIDVVFEDDTNKILLLVQATWGKDKPTEDKVKGFFDLHRLLKDPAYVRQGGADIQRLVGDYGEKIDDGYSVIMRFACRASVPADSRLRAVATASERDYGEGVVCEFLDRADIFERIRILKSEAGAAPDVEFRIRKMAFFQFETPYPTAIARMTAGELIQLHHAHANRLYSENVRLPMYLTNLRINDEIVRTAQEQPDSFFYFNNGISAICESFTVEDNLVRAAGFQIINGAQTLGGLVKANYTGEVRNVTVLFRLTQIGGSAEDSDFRERIILYNNTQNPVKEPDFRSNDPIQRFLQNQLGKHFSGKGPVPNFYYRAKRGYKPKGIGGKALDREYFANVVHSFRHQPTVSFKAPKTLWDNTQGGRYWEVFGDEACKPTETWSLDLMAQSMVAYATNLLVEQAHAELKADRAATPETLYLKRLARYVTALAAVGLRAHLGKDEKSRPFENFQDLLDSKEKFTEVINPLITAARSDLLTAFNQRKKEKAEVQPEYNLARDESTWLQLSDTIQQKVAGGLV
jgi:hypothetical protein